MRSRVLASITAFDHESLRVIGRWRPRLLTTVLVALTWSGTGRAWLLAAAVLWGLQSQGRAVIPEQGLFLQAMLAALLAWAASFGLKRVVGRRRPEHALPGSTPLVETPQCRSFPSGHSATAAALFSALVASGHPSAAWVGAWAFFVSYSRVYLGVHFPSDVLGGWGLGVMCAFVLAQL